METSLRSLAPTYPASHPTPVRDGAIKLPTVRSWGPRQRARTRIKGTDYYLGAYGSPEAGENYQRLVSEWLRGQLPESGAKPPTVVQIGDRYLAWAETNFVKRGEPTKTVARIARALELLYRAGVGDITATRFGPLKLKAFQNYLASHPEARWSRSTANELVATVVGLFQWAVSEELVDESVWRALQSVKPIRKGSCGLREDRRVTSVPRLLLRRSRRYLPTTVRLMVNVQILTGMRPGELVSMRGSDLQKTRNPRVYSYAVAPDVHKLDHVEDLPPKIVYIGPRATRLIRAALGLGPEDALPAEYVFSPERAERARKAEISAGRKTPKYPSHDPELRRARRGTSPTWRDHYDVNSYRKAIVRACAKAFGVDEQGKPKARWFPNQLRHSAATAITDRESLHVAQSVLGHADIQTTLKYVDVHGRRAIAAALKHG